MYRNVCFITLNKNKLVLPRLWIPSFPLPSIVICRTEVRAYVASSVPILISSVVRLYVHIESEQLDGFAHRDANSWIFYLDKRSAAPIL